MRKLLQALLDLLQKFFSGDADIRSIAWGTKVSQTFLDRISWTADALGIDVNWLMAVIAFESGRTFRPDIFNAAGSGAVGLIQFMPRTAEGLGTSSIELSQMTAEDQIRYVYKYLEPYKGRIKNISDLYMCILWPQAIGQPSGYVLFDERRQPKAYQQNAGLDADGDGRITKEEAAARIYRELEHGIRPENLWRGEVRTTI